MAWELLAIWLIVATTIVLFIRDERRIATAKLAARARRFATAPAFQHHEMVSSAPRPLPQADRPSRDLVALQRRFAESMRRTR